MCRYSVAVVFFALLGLVQPLSPFYLGFTQHTGRQEEERAGNPFQTPDKSGNVFLTVPERKQAFLPVEAGTVAAPIDPAPVTGNSSYVATPPSKRLVMAYYPDWVDGTFPPEKIDFKRFDWIDFAFAVPDASYGLTWDAKNAPDLLKRLVVGAHENGAKVKLSLGGWTGSKYFSSAVANEQSRATFVKNIVALYQTFNLDGIDIDWEYPGRQGAPGNRWHPSDADNFLLFLKLLRSLLPPTARISAAVDTTTFTGSNGKPMTDVSKFGQLLDWVLIMNYDVWGSSPKPGPNAPLRDACGNSTQPHANAVAAVSAWTKAYFPTHKMVLGLPSYGYISSSTTRRLRTRAKTKQKKAKPPSTTPLKIVSEDGGSQGQVQFRELIRQGALVPSKPIDLVGQNVTTFIGSGGFERFWDSCSETPYLRSSRSRQVIAYDDLESLSLKAAFAREVGILGVNLFDVHGDTDGWDFTDCIRETLGLI